MSFMTFVLSSPDNILTPEIAFVSLSLFNLIRMPLTSITIFLYLFLLFYLPNHSFPILHFSSSYIDHSVHSG